MPDPVRCPSCGSWMLAGRSCATCSATSDKRSRRRRVESCHTALWRSWQLVGNTLALWVLLQLV